MVKHLKEGHTRRVNSIIAVGNQVWTAGDDLSIFVWDAEVIQTPILIYFLEFSQKFLNIISRHSN